MRRNPLLRFLPQPPREQTRRHDEAPGHRIRRTRRTLALLLPGRSLCRVLITGRLTDGYAVCCKRDCGYPAVAELDADDDRAARHLAAIVESSDDAIISKDLNGVVTSWNRAAESMFGYTANEMIGRSIRTIIPADRQSEEEDVLGAVRRGERVEHFDTVRQRKDGTFLPISLTVSPDHDRHGTVIGASKIARDISDRKLAEAERAWLLSRAREASHLKDEFLATLFHELRTPLNAIVGYASMLSKRQLEGVSHERAVEAIERNASSLAQLWTTCWTFPGSPLARCASTFSRSIWAPRSAPRSTPRCLPPM